jgi:spermidine/putrescine-binding protein
VHVAYYDTNETLETKLLAGSSGFDIVVPTASYFERQIKAGVYLTLDKIEAAESQEHGSAADGAGRACMIPAMPMA